VCRRHGAYRNNHDESTALTSCFGSEFDKNQVSVPVEVAVCVVIANNQVEV
jgi:hypothetical protein